MMKSFPLYVQILLGAAAGVAVGLVLGPTAIPLGEIGGLLLQAIKLLAGPLIFVAILDALLRTHMTGKQARHFVIFLAINAVASVVIALLVANLARPGHWMRALGVESVAPSQVQLEKPTALNFHRVVKDLLPGSVLEPLTTNSITGIAILALFLGLTLRAASRIPEAKAGVEVLADVAHAVMKGMEVGMRWIIRWVPLAVFAVIARIVGEKGLAPLASLPAYVGAVLFALGLQVLLVYQTWIRGFARMPLGEFWRKARDPVAYALGASSSLATLPVTLRTLDEEFRVGKSSSRLVACVGTNLNNDGIFLYEALAVLVVAQIYGIDLSFAQQAMAVGACWLAAVGIGGIPDAGLISLSIVLATVGLPLEILPLLLAVDWILSRARATTNVICDLTGSIVLDRWAARR